MLGPSLRTKEKLEYPLPPGELDLMPLTCEDNNTTRKQQNFEPRHVTSKNVSFSQV